jgi:endonuclease/exonuclease/phosphatase family metal-dependent hydrolase
MSLTLWSETAIMAIMKKSLFILMMVLMASLFAKAQQKQYKIAAIGFYNLENLFDTIDNPLTNDEDFLPSGSYRYNTAVYVEKQRNIARVIGDMATDLSPDGLAILGVAEVENRDVLEDLIQQEALKKRQYQIVHFDSPDPRGIDVGLLYQAKYYTVTGARPIPMIAYEEGGVARGTRDILLVSGWFDGDPLHVLVNHWPSRRGGEAATRPLRNAAALTCKNIADSITLADPKARVIIMGDLNDDPVSPSVKTVLNAKRTKEETPVRGFFNPFYDFYKKGIGTLAYQDSWNLFDQIILSHSYVNPKLGGYQFYQANVYNAPYLYQSNGHFKGYPHRTFSGSTYIGGYSDHFPTFVYLVKALD